LSNLQWGWSEGINQYGITELGIDVPDGLHWSNEAGVLPRRWTSSQIMTRQKSGFAIFLLAKALYKVPGDSDRV
jgi:hypothetical protein